MSSSRFAHKRIAYLAASQGFNQDMDVILLTTNLLKKELRGGVYEAGLAINCISNIVTEDLAKDLLPELTSLTAHPQPYLRKKALLCLFKVRSSSCGTFGECSPNHEEKVAALYSIHTITFFSPCLFRCLWNILRASGWPLPKYNSVWRIRMLLWFHAPSMLSPSLVCTTQRIICRWRRLFSNCLQRPATIGC